MTTHDPLLDRFPALRRRLPKTDIGRLPTPVKVHDVRIGALPRRITIKYDNLTSEVYGGNKVRKLEYLMAQALRRDCRRVATFGAVGSNHALATALHAHSLNLSCTCFLSHQAMTPMVGTTLRQHLACGTEIVRFGGPYAKRIEILRRHLSRSNVWVIPMGGTSWLGTLGFVAAGLELAAQIEAREIPRPDRVYVGTGTMGTAVGLALGLALAKLDTEVHAVRVSDVSITNMASMSRLAHKTAVMMQRMGADIEGDIASKLRIQLRDEYFGPGYARTTPDTEAAIAFGQDELGLQLEGTYTGKTMAALLADVQQSEGINALYWHTYNSATVASAAATPSSAATLPVEFRKYLDEG